jgi:hypothetical protein
MPFVAVSVMSSVQNVSDVPGQYPKETPFPTPMQHRLSFAFF